MLCTEICNGSMEFDSYYMKSVHISEGRAGIRGRGEPGGESREERTRVREGGESREGREQGGESREESEREGRTRVREGRSKNTYNIVRYRNNQSNKQYE